MDYHSLLNPVQYEAVTSKAQHLRIVAGAGSGKTRVLTYRISYLIGELHINPARILAIAFTNKAAQEMKNRALKIIPEVGQFLHISTFHSFCARFLRIECSAIGYPRTFTIFDEDDQANLVKEICVEMGYKKGDSIVKESLHYIRAKKARGQYPENVTLSIKADVTNERECLKVFGEYEARKDSMFALDFDDLLLKSILVLEQFEDIRQRWQMRFDHILVDEFQDTNDIQFHLMMLLVTEDTSVYVVGDPDQTIYTWRGANQKIILDFNRTFPDAETIILNQNYRSTEVILSAANKLIAHNKKRVPKDLFTEEKSGESIFTYRGYSPEDEALKVAKEVKRIAREQSGDFSNVAVLYRSSYVTRPFESQFAADGIPYRVFGGL
ncbi:MAG: UvrD-helicase domain-containing protein, partial [Bacilli bacterium]|nr:UvrD-helicase domain-containing protein [Bacilli bacterium]